ncbi:hypothetical protein [Mycoplasmopsis canis]|nr:hypothetical protein [Mycoplasmopsis canis]
MNKYKLKQQKSTEQLIFESQQIRKKAQEIMKKIESRKWKI